MFGEQKLNEISLRFEHHSNAAIKQPNPGENFLQLRYARRFWLKAAQNTHFKPPAGGFFVFKHPVDKAVCKNNEISKFSTAKFIHEKL